MIDAPFPLRARRATSEHRDALATVVRAWRRERALRATVERLSSLSDHTLRDIGLHRGDIVAGVTRRSGES